MTCTPIDLGNGVTGIVCTRGERAKPCKECGRRATRQCDYPLRGKAAGRTCSVYLCERCAVRRRRRARLLRRARTRRGEGAGAVGAWTAGRRLAWLIAGPLPSARRSPAQGFPDDYDITTGPHGKRLTKTEQIALCGNSVCPPQARALVASAASGREAIAS